MSDRRETVDELCARLTARDACVAVIGLGYVGLPLLLEFARAGFRLVGYDCDRQKIDRLAAGESYIRHVPAERIADLLAGKETVTLTSDVSAVETSDAILICVPTPLSEHRDPDLSYVTGTAEAIAPHLRPNQLVCLESTTYPGTTEDVLTPILEKASGLTAGDDFHVAYSPEREDPCNADFQTSTIPKVVGGITPDSLRIARALYDTVICRTIPVSSCRAAEATKLMENIFRCVNIALVNELKMVFTSMDIDIWEVIEAAKTKPFGYMPFYPGPGLGGHCIPIDPFYLTWKAREFDVATRFIELAGEINTAMPDYVVGRTMTALNERAKPLNGSRLLLVGLAYKSNVDDTRESPTFLLWRKFAAAGAIVDYHDPLCPVVPRRREFPELAGRTSVPMEAIAAGEYDAAIVCTNHQCVDHDAIATAVDLVVDTRNACSAGPNICRA